MGQRLGTASALCGALVLPCSLHAAEDVAALDQVVVTGSRIERPVMDAPLRTEVVGRAELERVHARSLKEGLENVPGLQLREIHGKAGHEVVLQGLSGDQVLVLVDGLPLTATTGSTVDVSQLAVLDIERIEVVKGALSAQYGSAAMGGVVNVITRRIQPGFAGEVRGDFGSFGEQNPSGTTADAGNRHTGLRLEGGTERFRLRLTGDQRERAGIDPDPESWARPGDATDRQQYDLRGEWHPSPGGAFHLQAGRFQEEIDSRFDLRLPGRTVEQSRFEDVTRNRLQGGGHWHWRNGVSLRGQVLDEQLSIDTIKEASDQRFDDRDADIGLSQVSLQGDVPLLAGQHLHVGADLRREDLRQFKDGNSELDGSLVERESQEVWSQLTLVPAVGWSDVWAPLAADRAELLLGVRAQDDSDFGQHVVGSANLRLELWQGASSTGALRLGWGQGYRVPNLKERHFRFDHSQLGYVVIGNPDLQPEESNSFQAGWTHSWGRWLWLEVGLFDNQLQNLIQVDVDSAQVDAQGIQQFRYDNVERARTQGLEMGSQLRLRDDLRLVGGYTFMRTRDEDTGGALTRRPRHQGRLGIDWALWHGTEMSLRGRYQSDELVDSNSGARSPSWTVLDFRLNHALTPTLGLFGGIDNLFDRQRDFADPADFSPVAGRFVYLGARYRFGDR
ncbi:TonB-dependent receptor plug domain-containing protein [Algiphilus sp.]|uniref:TonB-dependent receptor plug domain-containing protein n=1 Tax=Algiphilus sp. TaxID=1872431 RepID=UPI003B52D60B